MKKQSGDYLKKAKASGQAMEIPCGDVVFNRKKAVPERHKNAVPEGSIYFEGYASKTTKDRYQDVIPASFWSEKTLKSTTTRFVKEPFFFIKKQRHNVRYIYHRRRISRVK